MVQRAPADVAGRLKGDINYGNGRIAKGTDLYMKFWQDRVLSVPEPRYVVPHRGYPLGQVRADDRREGAGEEGEPRGHLARRGKAIGVAASDIPTSPSRGKETFFDGKVFRSRTRPPISPASPSSASPDPGVRPAMDFRHEDSADSEALDKPG